MNNLLLVLDKRGSCWLTLGRDRLYLLESTVDLVIGSIIRNGRYVSIRYYLSYFAKLRNILYNVKFRCMCDGYYYYLSTNVCTKRTEVVLLTVRVKDKFILYYEYNFHNGLRLISNYVVMDKILDHFEYHPYRIINQVTYNINFGVIDKTKATDILVQRCSICGLYTCSCNSKKATYSLVSTYIHEGNLYYNFKNTSLAYYITNKDDRHIL
jgi:hypothetical protein